MPMSSPSIQTSGQVRSDSGVWMMKILNYIEYAKAKGCSMTGPEDPEILHLNVLA